MAQDFSCSTVDFVRITMTDMWSDANFKREVQPEVSIVTALQDMQTADIRFFEDGTKRKKATVYWVEACEGAVADCTTSCNFTGTNVSSNCKNYEISNCKESIFQIDDTDFFDNFVEFSEAVAKGMLKHATLLDNQIEVATIAALDSFTGANLLTTDSRATLDGAGNTFIDGPFWTPSLLSYFAKVRRRNYMPEAMMFSGDNMFDHWWNAQRDFDNANGKGAKNKFDAFNWHFDIVNFDTVLGADKTLMVSPHAAAFVSANRVVTTEEITNGADIIRFSIDSPNIPGVKYDVYYRTICKNAGEDIEHVWRIVSRYDIFQTPVLCDATQDATGILSFECGVAP